MDVAFKLLTYEFVVCVLLMLASEKIGLYVGLPFGRHRAMAARYTQLSVFTFGAGWGLLISTLFVTFSIMIFLSN